MSTHGPIRAKHPAPSVAKLIALLIEERAQRLAAARVCRACHLTTYASDADRDHARREIEAEVLTTKGKS